MKVDLIGEKQATHKNKLSPGTSRCISSHAPGRYSHSFCGNFLFRWGFQTCESRRWNNDSFLSCR